MQTIIRIVKSLSSTSTDPVEKLFLESANQLDNNYYSEIIKELEVYTEKYKSLFFLKSKNPLPRVVILRVYLLWHRMAIDAPNNICFIKELELTPASSRKYSKPTTFDLLIECYREYLYRRSVITLEESEKWTVKRWVAVSSQLLKLVGFIFRIQILLENEWNRAKNQIVFSLIGQNIIKDSYCFLQLLFEFVSLHSQLILEDHPDTDTINSLYEQILFASREASKRLKRITKQPIPELIVDKELNKSIEFHMANRKRKTQKSIDIGSSLKFRQEVEQTDDELHGENGRFRELRQPYTNEI